MEVLQIQRGRESCCLVLVSGRSSSPVLPGVWAVLDYVWTTEPLSAAPRIPQRCALCIPSTRSAQPKHIVLSVRTHAPAVREARTRARLRVHGDRSSLLTAERDDRIDARRSPGGNGGCHQRRQQQRAERQRKTRDIERRHFEQHRLHKARRVQPTREPAGGADQCRTCAVRQYRAHRAERGRPQRDADPDSRAYAARPRSSTCRTTRRPSARDQPPRRSPRAVRAAARERP